jgi:transcriptional regulator with XRE-family HTH domain
MYTVDIKELKGMLAKNDVNKTKLGKILGVSRTTITNYFKNPGQIPYDKIAMIATALNMTPDEARNIFFHQKLTQTQDNEQGSTNKEDKP